MSKCIILELDFYKKLCFEYDEKLIDTLLQAKFVINNGSVDRLFEVSEGGTPPRVLVVDTNWVVGYVK